MVRRSVRSGVENWIVLREKFKSRSSLMLNLFKSREKRVQDALGNSQTLEIMQGYAPKDQIDADFASHVRSGRRFASGIFSVLVFTFVGTLTSALSVWVCEERDGVMYVSQDAYVECSLNDTEYNQLFSVAIFGLFLYGLVLPLSIFLLLCSKWCRRMMIYDLSGFDALFGFLTSRYSTCGKSWFFFKKRPVC